MADISTPELMDTDEEKTPQRENKKLGGKEKREGILQQHHERVKDRKSGWILKNVQNECYGF